MNTVSIFVVFYECAFRLTAVEEASSLVMVIEFVLLGEIIAHFFKAFPDRDSPRGFICSLFGICGLCKNTCRRAEPPSKNRHDVRENDFNAKFRDVAVRYLTGMFIIDSLSVVPFLMAKLAALEVPYLELLERGYMRSFAYLRLLRIT